MFRALWIAVHFSGGKTWLLRGGSVIKVPIIFHLILSGSYLTDTTSQEEDINLGFWKVTQYLEFISYSYLFFICIRKHHEPAKDDPRKTWKIAASSGGGGNIGMEQMFLSVSIDGQNQFFHE